MVLKRCRETGALARVCVASDTPTGTGVMPMGVIKSVCELASLGDLPAAEAIALATGNNARALRLAAGTGTLAVGAPADLVVYDVPAASLAKDALDAIACGDIPGISCVVIDGVMRVGRSRTTPLAKRLATFKGVAVAGAGHLGPPTGTRVQTPFEPSACRPSRPGSDTKCVPTVSQSL